MFALQFVSMRGINKGHLTVMWNRLFEKAYHEGNDSAINLPMRR